MTDRTAAGPSAPAAPLDSALRQAVDVLYRRRDDALIVGAVVLVISLAFTFTATPTYEASAQLLIEAEAPNVVSFEEVLEQNRTTLEYYQTQYRLLQSRTLARRTLDAAKLWDHPHFLPRPQPWYSPRRAVGTVRGWVGGLIGGASASASTPAPAATRQAQTLDAFLAGLRIVPVRNSHLVDVRYVSPDPRFAATAANALVSAYLAQSLELRTKASREASAWLTEQMALQRKAVESAELALQRYREDFDSISLHERQNIVIQRLADLNAALTRARTERISKETSYQRLQEIRKAGGSLESFPAVMANGLVQQLKTELASLQRQEAELSRDFGDLHPKMDAVRTGIDAAQKKLTAEINSVVQAVQNEFVAAQRDEQSLQQALDVQKGEAQLLNRRAIEYGVLERDAKATQQVFDGLVTRTKEAGISGELKTSNIHVVDDAEVPRSPSYPDRTMSLVLALAAATTFGLGFVFIVELLDNRIKSPAELKAAVPLPCLGSIPISTPTHGQLLVHNGAPAAFTEAVRLLRSNILFAAPGTAHRSVVVTSALAGEGKTLVASNLALSLAMAGQRVLLVDADMRQPRIHQLFGVPQQPGLSGVIARQTKPSAAIQKTAVVGLWVLPAGECPANPPELLGSKAFGDMLNAFGETFEWVILDSPPVTGMADAAVIGHVATGVLFVVGSEMTTRAAARTAIEQLDAARVTYVGTVLNRLDTDGHPYYYYRRA